MAARRPPLAPQQQLQPQHYRHATSSSVSSLGSCCSLDTMDEYDDDDDYYYYPNDRNSLYQQQQQHYRRLNQHGMAILACSSPEIQALHKMAPPLDNNYNNNNPTATSTTSLPSHPAKVVTPPSGPSFDMGSTPRNLPVPNFRSLSPTSSITSYSGLSQTNLCVLLASLEDDDWWDRRNDTTRCVVEEEEDHDNCDDDRCTPPRRSALDDPVLLLRKPSLHRRVSYDSLPSPREIGAFPTAPPPPQRPRLVQPVAYRWRAWDESG